MKSLFDSVLKFQHRVEARANALGDELVAVLEGAQDHLIGKLAQLGPDQAGGFSARRLAAQRAQVEVVLAQVYGQAAPALMQEAALDVWTASARFVADQAPALALTVAMPTIDAEAVTLWAESTTVEGLTLTDWLGRLEGAAADRIIAAGRQGMMEGLGIDSFARLMRAQGIEGSVPGLRGLASTFSAHASNHARDETIQELFGEVVTGWQYVATLDRRACLRCAAQDGRVYKDRSDAPATPLHFRCRCLLVPLTNVKGPGGERPAIKHDERTVNHRDGSKSTKFSVASAEQVPSSMTYQAWMQGQLKTDPAFVKEVLGPGRFKLFAEGKLNLSSMVSNGRIKTLRELKA